LILLLAAVLLLAVVAQRFGWRGALALLGIAAVAAPPRALFDGQFFGVSATPAVLATVVLVLVGLLTLGRRGISLRFVPLLVFALAIGSLAWTQTDRLPAAAGLLVLGSLFWVAGSSSASLLGNRPNLDRAIAAVVLMLIALQAVVTVLQTLGFDIFSDVSEAGELTEGRANGMFGHPGTMGKNIVLISLLAVPLTASKDPRTRRLAFLSLIVAIVPVGLSESRSNFAALIALLLTWALLMPRGKGVSIRLALPVGAGIIALMFYETIAARFLNDPGGGQRGHFMEVALAHIPDNLWIGVGPGGYIPFFGQFDPLTAEGWPVHNAFVLMVAELGLFGAALLFLPLLLSPAVAALKLLRSTGLSTVYARTVLASIPSIVIMATTGWGLVGAVILPMWMFVFGYLNRRMSEPQLEETLDIVATKARIVKDEITRPSV
jgi:hypothetical protein